MGNRIPQTHTFENENKLNRFYHEQKNYKIRTKSADKYLQMPRKTINEYLHNYQNFNTFTNEKNKNSPSEFQPSYQNEILNNFSNKIKGNMINHMNLTDVDKGATNLCNQVNNFKSNKLNTVNIPSRIKANSSLSSSSSSSSPFSSNSSLSSTAFTNSSTLSCLQNEDNLKSNLKQKTDRNLLEGDQFMKHISINKQLNDEIHDHNGKYLKSPVLNYEQGDTQQISSSESYKQNISTDDVPKKIPQLGLKRRSDGTVTYTAFLRPDSSKYTEDDSLAQLKRRAARYLIGLNRQYKCTVEFYSNPIPYRGSLVYALKITGPNHSDLIRCRNALPDCIEKCMITPFAHLDLTLHTRK